MPQVNVSRVKLANAIAACQRVIPARTPKEILKLARITYDGGKLTCAATDCEIAIAVDVECDGDGRAFDVLADPVILRGLIAGSDEVSLRTEGTTLVVECGGIGRIETSDPAEFPPMPECESGEKISVKAESFSAAISRSSVATDPDSTSFTLGGVHIDGKAGDSKITIVATDSRLMVVCPVPTESALSLPVSVTIPLKCAKAIAGVFNSSQIEIVITDNAIFVHGDSSRMSSNLLQGKFPRWRKIIPPKSEFDVNVLASAMKEACAKAALFSTEEGYGLDVHFLPGELVISRKIDKGSFRHSIPHDNQDCDLLAHLCHARVSKIASQVESTLEIRVIDGESAFVFVDGDTTSLLMPLIKGN